MKASEILAALKEKFNALTAPAAPATPSAPAPVALTEYTLQDGITKISVSDLNPGGTVSIKDGTGAETPAPAGDLVLQDGTVINVAEGGVIAAVTAPAPPAPPAMPAGMLSQEQLKEHWAKFASSVSTEDLAAMVKALFEDRFGWQIREEEDRAAREKAVSIYKENFEKAEVTIKEIQDQFSKYKQDSEKVTGDLLQLVELLVQEPAGEPDPSATRGINLKKPEPTKEQFAKALFSKK